jgi:hypothetical protein
MEIRIATSTRMMIVKSPVLSGVALKFAREPDFWRLLRSRTRLDLCTAAIYGVSVIEGFGVLVIVGVREGVGVTILRYSASAFILNEAGTFSVG